MIQWIAFDAGKSLGSQGSESGIIIKDEEIENSARITIEKDGQIAPFAITLGIYGLTFHTNFYSSIQTAEEDFKWYKQKIEEILALYGLQEEERNGDWNIKHNQLLGELTNR